MRNSLVEVSKNIFYPKKIVERLCEVFGEDRIKKVFSLSKKPFMKYYLRVNLLRTDRDFVISLLKDEGVKAYKDKLLEEAIYIKVRENKGFYERAKEVSKYVVVDRHAAESVMMGSDLFAPGIKRCSSFSRGDEVKVLSPNGEVVGVGRALMNPSNIFNSKEGLAVKIEESPFTLPKIRELVAFKRGLIFPQSLSAMIVSRVMNPLEGEKILDMCSAPGGKLTHIYMLTKGKSLIVGIDRKNKIKKIEFNLERLGYTSNVLLLEGDSRYTHKFISVQFDRILIDPPCSSMGVRPKIFDRKTMGDIRSFHNYQLQFFEPAFKLVKRGGIIVYSTCTYTIEENELVLEKVINKYNLEVLPIPEEYFIGEEGLISGTMRIFPDKVDSTGFFIALLKKKG